jgi:hypothetical protein
MSCITSPFCQARLKINEKIIISQIIFTKYQNKKAPFTLSEWRLGSWRENSVRIGEDEESDCSQSCFPAPFEGLDRLFLMPGKILHLCLEIQSQLIDVSPWPDRCHHTMRGVVVGRLDEDDCLCSTVVGAMELDDEVKVGRFGLNCDSSHKFLLASFSG